MHFPFVNEHLCWKNTELKQEKNQNHKIPKHIIGEDNSEASPVSFFEQTLVVDVSQMWHNMKIYHLMYII